MPEKTSKPDPKLDDNSSKTYQGCGQTYRAVGPLTESKYYRHCVNDCDQYQNLKLIRICRDCNRKCINYLALKQHCTSISVINTRTSKWFSLVAIVTKSLSTTELWSDIVDH